MTGGATGARKKLSDDVRIDVMHEDLTEFGSAASARIDREVAQAAAAIPPGAWDDLFASTRLGRLYAAPDRLRPEIVRPDPRLTRPVGLRVLGGGQASPAIVKLAPDLLSDLARWLGDWQVGAAPPRDEGARGLWDELERAGALVPASPDAPPRRRRPGALFVGHATVRIDDGDEAQVFDPFLVPRSAGTPAGYAPPTASELRPCAVFITHSHPDHFSLGSLLRLGADTQVFVPAVSGETLLSVDMAMRLEQLGFRRVRTLDWGQSVTLGRTTVTALPFYGEQPTTAEQLHPNVRNVGNVYHVNASGMRYGLIADAGFDRDGSMSTVAARARARGAGLDVLFGGYRSWSLYPRQYPLTSVARYLLFVPPALRDVRQKIMNDASDLLDTAEHWGARTVVPYADGGAPWFWEMGLGPRGDGGANDDDHFDPPPESVERAAQYRSNIGGAPVTSPVRVRIARPGQSLAADDPEDAPADAPGNPWPYRSAPSQPLLRRTVMSESELVALARKKVLLRILAAREVERLDIQVSGAEVQALLDRLRRDCGLETAEKMRTWMRLAGVDPDAFAELIAEWTGLVKLEDHYRSEIDGLADLQIAFGTMRQWPRTP